VSEDVYKLAYEKGYRVNYDGTVSGIYKNTLALGKGSNGYLNFVIRDGNRTRTVPVHRFASYCFFGEELYKHECVRHLNGDKTDNSRDNLALGSFADNYDDNPNDWKTTFAQKGAATKRKLSEDDVSEIKKLIGIGESCRSIGKKFNVAKSTIHQIKEGKSYRWVI
jgi:hypothetical protein